MRPICIGILGILNNISNLGFGTKYKYESYSCFKKIYNRQVLHINNLYINE